MSKYKAYPTAEMNAPHERVIENCGSVIRAVYNSSASAILTTEECRVINMMLETINDNSEMFEEETGEILGILGDGTKRMNGLHTVLGAFDVDANGVATKPEEEKIHWEKLRPKKSGLNLVE